MGSKTVSLQSAVAFGKDGAIKEKFFPIRIALFRRCEWKRTVKRKWEKWKMENGKWQAIIALHYTTHTTHFSIHTSIHIFSPFRRLAP